VLEIIESVIMGAISGAITCLLGYAKSITVEKFDPRKARQTIIVGAVVGGIAGFYGWTYARAETWAASVGIITMIEYVKKSLIRVLKKG